MSSFRIGNGAIFAGIAKNVYPYISQVLGTVSECAGQFAKRKIIIVENDSTDGTEDALTRWASISEDHIYIRADDNILDELTRTERLAYFRNIYIREIEKTYYDSLRYVILFDCDNVNSKPIDKESIIEAIQFLEDDDKRAAVFANARGFYYDIWPLRHPIWCPGDCWDEVRRLSTFISYPEAILTCVGARQIRIKSTSAPIPVISAFGGLAIYKRRFLLGRRYLGRYRGGLTSEHVAVNESISGDGGKLFILPKLLVNTPYEHIHRARDKVFFWTWFAESYEDWHRRVKFSLASTLLTGRATKGREIR
jgi:Glycosyl transferase family 2